MPVLLGIDLGTSGVKVLALSDDGKTLASENVTYPLLQPRAGWSEQNASDWWLGVTEAINKILENDAVSAAAVSALSISGQMHGSVFLDADGQVIRNPILWNDTRTIEQCKYITQKIGEDRLLDLVGNPALDGFTLPKVLWLRDNEPENYRKVKYLLLPKDYILYKLTGRICTEISDAAGTLLLDVKNRRWSETLCDLLDIDPTILPEVLESLDVVGTISKEIIEKTGLPSSVKVIAGGADNACSAVGNGIVEEGIILASIGSSGVVLAHTDTMAHDPHGRIHSFNHSVPQAWYLMGVTLSAGMSMSWLKNELIRKDYDYINREADSVTAGSEGVIFLPYLFGERTPHRNPHARGVFFGLSGIHSQKHLMRSVFEGVAFALKDSLELIKALGVSPRQIRLTGGGAKSTLWRQILADVFATEVSTMEADEGPAYGAGLLAAVGSGLFSSIKEATTSSVKIDGTTEHDKHNADKYNTIYPVFKSLYNSLKDDFEKSYQINME